MMKVTSARAVFFTRLKMRTLDGNTWRICKKQGVELQPLWWRGASLSLEVGSLGWQLSAEVKMMKVTSARAVFFTRLKMRTLDGNTWTICKKQGVEHQPLWWRGASLSLE